MLRPVLLVTILALQALGPAAPAVAQTGTGMGLSPAEEILRTLKERGYQIIEDEKTWLGRQRVVAVKNGMRRELVFIPSTGEVLRDYALRMAEGGGNDNAGNATGVASAGVASAGSGATQTRSAGDTGTPSAVGVSVGDPVGIGAADAAAGGVTE